MDHVGNLTSLLGQTLINIFLNPTLILQQAIKAIFRRVTEPSKREKETRSIDHKIINKATAISVNECFNDSNWFRCFKNRRYENIFIGKSSKLKPLVHELFNWLVDSTMLRKQIKVLISEGFRLILWSFSFHQCWIKMPKKKLKLLNFCGKTFILASASIWKWIERKLFSTRTTTLIAQH